MKKRKILLQVAMLLLCNSIFANNYYTIPVEISNINVSNLFLADEENFKNSFYETTGESYSQANFEVFDCLKHCKCCLLCKMKKILLFTKQYCWAVYKDENGNLVVIILKYICGILYYSIQLM